MPLAAAAEPRDLERLAFPIGFVEAAGGPADGAGSAAATFQLLRDHNGGDHYAHLVVRGYHGDDCIAGSNAPRDVYRWLADHLVIR
jgi:hypothetical protein